MTYDEALGYIHNTLKFGVKLGLHNIELLLKLMGNPHKKLKFVHVAGTNGKGSTVAFISSILIESGYKVGIYTSPFIERFTERMKINSEEIPQSDLARITEFVKSKVDIMLSTGENHPTEFEIVTAIAFQYFYESNCDIVVLEVGLGGRFDSTNIIDTPILAVITTISYDHMAILGDTLSEIAFEKAGIIKHNCDVLIYPQNPEAKKVIAGKCKSEDARSYFVDFNSIKINSYDIRCQEFDFEKYSSIKISLLGEYQVKNAAMAIKASEILMGKGFSITEETMRVGLEKAKWPGRFELLNEKPIVVVDGAHNIEGITALLKNLKVYFPKNKFIFIMGVLKDKDYEAMIKTIIPIANKVICITPDSERALPAKELAIFIKPYCENTVVSDTIEFAISTSIEAANADDVICVFGSLYYIGKVRHYFFN